ALGGRDVLVIFVESYRPVTFDRPDVRGALAPARAAPQRAAAATGRAVASARVEPPTFAGAPCPAPASSTAGGRLPDGRPSATPSTHVPFRPTPPYQRDWPRMTSGAAPYEPDAVARALEKRPDWLDLAPAYVDSVRYALETIAGFLEWQADDDLVLILIGDH